jgi:hypothetical protein
MAHGFTWNITRAQASYIYLNLPEPTTKTQERVFRPLINELEMFINANPYRRTDGSPIRPGDPALRSHSQTQESLGQPRGD